MRRSPVNGPADHARSPKRSRWATACVAAAVATGTCAALAGSSAADAAPLLPRANVISHFAGAPGPSGGGDGGPASNAGFATGSIATDSAGDLYIADPNAQNVRRIDASSGIITTVAGQSGHWDGEGVNDGDGGPATAAHLRLPYAVTVDSAGNLFVLVDIDNGPTSMIRRVDAATGVITSIAHCPDVCVNMAVDGAGHLYISTRSAVLVLDTSTDTMSTVPITASHPISGPPPLAVDAAGNLYFGDGQTVEQYDPGTGTTTRIAGNGTAPRFGSDGAGDGGQAVNASLDIPAALAYDNGLGALYIGTGSWVRSVDMTTGLIVTAVGSPNGAPATSTPVPATEAAVGSSFMAVAPSGRLYVGSGVSNEIAVVTCATRPGGGVCPAAQPSVASSTVGSQPVSVGFDSLLHRAYVANAGSKSVSVVNTSTNKVVKTIALSAAPPTAVAVDAKLGKVLVAEPSVGKVAVISAGLNRVLTTVAVGSGPNSIAVDTGTHRVFVSNSGSGSVTSINAVTNAVIQTVPVSGGAGAVAVDSGLHQLLVVATGGNYVQRFDVGARIAIPLGVIPVGANPVAIAVDATAHVAYVANQDDDTITPIDIALGDARPAFAGVPGSQHDELAVDPAAHRLYVTARQLSADADTPMVLVGIDTVSDVLTDATLIAAHSTGVAVDSATHHVWVDDQAGNSVTVLDNGA